MITQSPAGSLEDQKARVITASSFARKSFERQPELLEELLASGDLERSYPDTVIADALSALLRDCPDGDELARRLRRFRLREMLRIVWRDFTRQARTMETTRDTSPPASRSSSS